MKYATRINSFLRTGCTVPEALDKIGTVEGVSFVDMNYPEHFKNVTPEEIRQALARNHLRLNAMNLRFRDEFLFGAFDNPDPTLRQKAVTLCQEAARLCKELDGRQCIIWLGFDGFDYSFQKDYISSWRELVSCFREVCQSVDCNISCEYKPYEERVFAGIESWGSAWKLMEDVGCENFGITLDFCHMLMKKENPAFAAALLLDKGRLFGIHVNDGEGSTDDGLIVGTVHPFKTLELFYYLKKFHYQDVIYFDTFPKREDAVEECRLNRRMCGLFEDIIDRIGLEEIGRIISQNNGEAAAALMAQMMTAGNEHG